MGKFFQKRNIKRWLGETSTQEGIIVVATVGAQAYGVPPEITMGILSLLGLNAMRRMPSA
jgi:hypothetical protein